MRMLDIRPCLQCEESFDKSSDLKVHLALVHKQYGNHFITPAEKKKEKEEERRREIQSTRPEILETFVCSICGHKAKQHRSTHMRRYHKEIPCEDCGEICGGEIGYRLHRRTYHYSTLLLEKNEKRKQNKEFVCEHCGKSFDSKYACSSHISKMHKAKDIACERCEEHFEKKTDYRNHLREQHAVEPWFSCQQCDYKTYDEQYLKNHLKMVHSEKKFECKECGKTLKHQASLRSHVQKVHLKLPKTYKFPCPTCNKKFHTTEQLTNHMNVHSGAKPYKCFYCENAYQNKSNRLNHIKKSHPDLHQKQQEVVTTEDSQV